MRPTTPTPTSSAGCGRTTSCCRPRDAAVEDEIWDAAGDVELHTSEAIGRKPGRRPSPSGVRKGGKSPSSKQSSKAAAAEAAGRAYTHKQALAHGVKDGCIDSSMSSGAAASMVM